MEQRRIFYLDFIRIISVLLIFIYHFYVTIESFEINLPIPFITDTATVTLGHIGVSLFLLLSGASLAHTYPKYSTLKAFYQKRFFSIFPAFWLIYLGLFLWFDVPEHSGIFSSETPLGYLIVSILGMDGYLSPIIPNFYKIGEWFLGMIIILYLLFPFFYLCMKKFPRVFFIMSILWYFLWTRFFPFKGISIERSIFVRAFDFILGMYLVTYIIPYLKKNQYSLFSGYLSILGCIILFFCPLPFALIDRIELNGICIFIALCMGSFLITSELIFKICKWVSQCSYPFFLIHHVVLSRVLHNYAFSSLSIIGYIVVLMMTFFYTLFIASGIERILVLIQKTLAGR